MASKAPPPDTVGNLQGRMGALKATIRRNVAMDVQHGEEHSKALVKWRKATAATLKDLQERLLRVESGVEPSPSSEAPVASEEAPKKRSATRVPADYNDLLDTLSNL